MHGKRIRYERGPRRRRWSQDTERLNINITRAGRITQGRHTYWETKT